jgi:protein-disulfide isomerase
MTDDGIEFIEEALPTGGEEKARESTPEITITLRRGHLITILMPLTFALGIGLGYLVWGRAPVEAAIPVAAESSSTNASSPTGQATANPTQQQVVRYNVPTDDDPSLGPTDATITIIEFSDYECPYCQRWHAEVFTKLMETYPDQVRLVYRDFPLSSIHPNAFPAAEAANCANEQDGFWDFHDRLFSMELGLSDQAYEQYARQLGLDQEAFVECLDNGRYKEEVQSDFDYAAELGVRSTPTFFINGIAVVGAQPFEVFQQVIDKEMAGEIP